MFVYVISAGEHQKIGITKDISSRLQALQTGCPRLLEVAFASAVPHARHVEREAHALLKKFHLCGEWFDVAVDVAIAAVRTCIYEITTPDPEWNAHGGWQHAVGDSVVCRLGNLFGYRGPHPVPGERYTIAHVYEQGAVDLVELPNEWVAHGAFQFWGAGH
jgi:hypothetical protein